MLTIGVAGALCEIRNTAQRGKGSLARPESDLGPGIERVSAALRRDASQGE